MTNEQIEAAWTVFQNSGDHAANDYALFKAGYQAALSAAPAAEPAPSGWRSDMENAPRDGSWFLSHGGIFQGKPFVARFRADFPPDRCWEVMNSEGAPYAHCLLKWMPLSAIGLQTDGRTWTVCDTHPTAQPAPDALVEALKACRAWHYAEHNTLGSFSQRTDLCSYSEWLTQKALAAAMPEFAPDDYKPVPVIFGEGNGAETITKWVDELIDHERKALAKGGA